MEILRSIGLRSLSESLPTNPPTLYLLDSQNTKETSQIQRLENLFPQASIEEIGVDSEKLFDDLLGRELWNILRITPDSNRSSYSVNPYKPKPNPEEQLWGNLLHFASPWRLGAEQIVSGKREGRKIGIPTCNLNYRLDNNSDRVIVPGVYYGWCRFPGPVRSDFLKPVVGKVLRRHQGFEDDHVHRLEYPIQGR